MKDDYENIEKDLFDTLSEYAAEGKTIAIEYFNNEMEVIIDKIEIQTVETIANEECLTTKTGLRIRLQNIISVAPE